jgi:LPS export ABC transporter protein LptC
VSLNLWKLFVILSLTTCWSCFDTRQAAVKYLEAANDKFPFAETFEVEMVYSDSGIIRARLITPLIQDFQEKDGSLRIMPKGLTVHFYEPEGSASGTLKADSGVIYSNRDLVSTFGHVHFVNENKEELYSQALHFNTRTFELYTESFVTLRRGTEVMYGQGLEATDNFARLRIRRPMGEFFIEDAESDF